jgi:hypothetical protein
MTDKCNNCNNCPISSGSSGSSSISGSGTVGTGTSASVPAGSELLGQDAYAVANENTVDTSSVPSTVIMDVLASIQSVLPDVMNSISDITGYMCRIYYPLGTSSMYGKNDNRIRYTSQPQVQKCFLGANLFAQTNMGVFDGSEFAPYVGEQPYLMTFNYRIPENSKVQIFYGTSYRWMKVRRHEALDGSGSPIMILNMLSPCHSNGELINDDPIPDETNPIVIDPVNNGSHCGQNLI